MSRFGYYPFSTSAREAFLHGYWDTPLFPKIFDQHFGVGLNEDEFARSSLFHRYYMRHRLDDSQRLKSGNSEVKTNSEKFLIFLDVNQFLPEEITVKTSDNYVIVHCKHEERADEHGFVTREFTRRYLIPENVDPESINSALTRDGILSIEALRQNPDAPKPTERVIPVKIDEKDITESKPGPSRATQI